MKRKHIEKYSMMKLAISFISLLIYTFIFIIMLTSVLFIMNISESILLSVTVAAFVIALIASICACVVYSAVAINQTCRFLIISIRGKNAETLKNAELDVS
jgi:hypothetical protein